MQPQPRYRKDDKIGGRYLVHYTLMGGMGEVYLCLDLKTIRPYALKTFQQRFQTQHLHQAFAEEVAIWVALEKHPNIVRCFRMDTFDNQPFMILEWVASEEGRGNDLRGWLHHQPLGLQLALEIALDLVSGLIHAQQKRPGFVHRDLKPENILMAQGGLAKITDFGLAQIAERAGLETIAPPQAETETRTRPKWAATLSFVNRQTNPIVGTPPYMAPEQWRGDILDERTDIYALGCILYEMITGHPPFPTVATTSEPFQRWLHRMQVQHETKHPPHLPSELPLALDKLVQSCLAKTPAKRPANLNHLQTQLIEIYRQQFAQQPPERPAPGIFTASDYNNRGLTYARLERHEAALADYRQAIHHNPQLAQAYVNRGSLYSKLQQYQQALDNINHALDINPNFDGAYYNRGVIYYELQQSQQALSDFNRAIALNPTFALAYNNRGNLYRERQQHQQALADFDRAIQLDPELALAYNNRGIAYRELQQPLQALADYNRAIELAPQDATTYVNRGLTYIMLLQQPQQALADFNQAIQLDPAYADAYKNRANTYRIVQQPQQALADYDRLIRLKPDDADAYFNRGLTYSLLQQPQRASADFDRVIQINPQDADAHFNLGSVLAQMGQLRESLPYFEQAAQLGHVQAAQAIAQVWQILNG